MRFRDKKANEWNTDAITFEVSPTPYQFNIEFICIIHFTYLQRQIIMKIGTDDNPS